MKAQFSYNIPPAFYESLKPSHNHSLSVVFRLLDHLFGELLVFHPTIIIAKNNLSLGLKFLHCLLIYLLVQAV
jgi:hypothetical protein